MTSGLDMFLQDLPTCLFIRVHQATAAVSKTPALAPRFVHPLTLTALLICSANVTDKVAISNKTTKSTYTKLRLFAQDESYNDIQRLVHVPSKLATLISDIQL